MARKHYFDEDVLKLLLEIDVNLHDSLNFVSACRKAGISDKELFLLTRQARQAVHRSGFGCLMHMGSSPQR